MQHSHEIGMSVRAGKEDKQPKVHSVFDATADTHFPSRVPTRTSRAPGSEMSTILFLGFMITPMAIWSMVQGT